MPTFAYYLLKVIICSGILYGYYLLALRNKRFHHYNRWYLLSAVALSFIIPVFKIEFWKETVQPTAVMKVITIVSDADVYVAKSTAEFLSWDNVTMAAFGLVSFVFLLSVIVALIKVFVLIKKYPKKIVDKLCFVFSSTPGTPFSFFQYVFWNVEIDVDSDEGKRVLKHELAHVEEMHSVDKLFMNLLLVVGWCNPFIWLIRKELSVIHEFIADRKAIADGDTHSLITMLLKTAYPSQSLLFANSFFHSPLKRRVLMLTKLNPRYSYLRRIMVLPLFVVVVIFFAFGQTEKKQQQHTVKSASSAGTLVPPKLTGGVKQQNNKIQQQFLKDRLKQDEAQQQQNNKNIQQFLKDRLRQNEAQQQNNKNQQQDLRAKQTEIEAQQVYQEQKFKLTLQVFGNNNEPAQFPGGLEQWRRYLERNLPLNLFAEKKVPVGKYFVVVSFTISKDGSVTDLRAKTKTGYGVEEESMKIISKRKWQPAKKDGEFIETQAEQAVTFEVVQEGWALVVIESMILDDIKINFNNHNHKPVAL